jgi:outer membrane protein TolC
MKREKVLSIAGSILLLSSLLPLLSFAKDIGIEEFLSLVSAYHPLFGQEELSADIQRRRSESLLGSQDWSFNLTPSYSHLGKASAGDYQVNAIDSAGVEADLGRPLWSTGGRLGFSAISNYTDMRGGIAASRRFYHGAGMSYVHPLLQNAKGKLDRLAYDLSVYSIDGTALQSEENRENYLAGAAARYLEWARLTEAAWIAEEKSRIANEQLGQVKKRFDANLVDRVDVLRAEDAVRIAEQTRLQIKSGWDALQAELAVISGSDMLYAAKPAYNIYSVTQLPWVEESLERAKRSSRLIKVLGIQKEQLERQRAGLEEQNRARLDLSVSAGVFGRDEQFGKSLGIYQPDFSLAVAYSTIFGKREVKGQIEALDLQIKQIEKGIKAVEVDLEASIRGILIQLREIEEILRLNRAQIQSAQEKTLEEIKLYNQGRGQLTFVIQSRDNEENAKLTYLDNAALYHTLLFQYRALMDALFISK